jgi:hypothetical protein
MCADAPALVFGVRTDTGTTVESALLTRDPRGKLFQNLQPCWGRIFLPVVRMGETSSGSCFSSWLPVVRLVVQEAVRFAVWRGAEWRFFEIQGRRA